jgi:hypothetical protein
MWTLLLSDKSHRVTSVTSREIRQTWSGSAAAELQVRPDAESFYSATPAGFYFQFLFTGNSRGTHSVDQSSLHRHRVGGGVRSDTRKSLIQSTRNQKLETRSQHYLRVSCKRNRRLDTQRYLSRSLDGLLQHSADWTLYGTI